MANKMLSKFFVQTPCRNQASTWSRFEWNWCFTKMNETWWLIIYSTSLEKSSCNTTRLSTKPFNQNVFIRPFPCRYRNQCRTLCCWHETCMRKVFIGCVPLQVFHVDWQFEKLRFLPTILWSFVRSGFFVLPTCFPFWKLYSQCHQISSTWKILISFVHVLFICGGTSEILKHATKLPWHFETNHASCNGTRVDSYSYLKTHGR